MHFENPAKKERGRDPGAHERQQIDPPNHGNSQVAVHGHWVKGWRPSPQLVRTSQVAAHGH